MVNRHPRAKTTKPCRRSRQACQNSRYHKQNCLWPILPRLPPPLSIYPQQTCQCRTAGTTSPAPEQDASNMFSPQARASSPSRNLPGKATRQKPPSPRWCTAGTPRPLAPTHTLTPPDPERRPRGRKKASGVVAPDRATTPDAFFLSMQKKTNKKSLLVSKDF